MHGLFWLSSTALLAATVWMLVSDANRPWKAYQRDYRRHYSPKATGGIRQIVLPELTQDLNFRCVARCDRCTTCHLGIEQTVLPLPLGEGRGEDWEENAGNDSRKSTIEQHQRITKPSALTPAPSPKGRGEEEIPQPFAAHSRLELYVGAGSPHPAEEFGCTICHEGQGSATDFHWAAHAPNDLAAALSWQAKYAWSRNPDWDFPMLPARFAESRCLQCHPSVTDLEPTARFPDPPTAKLVAGYQLVRRLGCYGCHELDDGPAGRTWLGDAARKNGPSLRQVAEKTSLAHLADRIADPAHFMPSSTMPRLFGLVEHLDGAALADAKRFEAVEIRAIAAYLMKHSEPASQPPAATATEKPSAERGKKLFELQGCLACHKHQDFPQGQAVQGPELSRGSAKYTAEHARQWLVAWLREPANCAPQTLMPNPRLDASVSESGGKSSDPAEDLAAYLLSSPGDFQDAELPPLVEKDLDALFSLYMKQDAATAVRDDLLSASDNLKLQEVGRRAIARHGCFGCHEIAGFEKSPGIGPTLAGWGSKATAQLAFEKIDEYVAARPVASPSDAINRTALADRLREGFLWQKLSSPRSFDYRVAAKKNFNELLRMGRFNLTDAEREAVMTYVLGLTANRPVGKYAYHPDAKRTATIAGRKVLDRFACAECHALEMERWTFSYKPGEFPRPPQPVNFAFLAPHFSEKELAASQTVNKKGFARAEIAGVPRLDSAGKALEDEDDEGRPICYFTLWQPAAIDGRAWTVGGPDVAVPLSQVLKKRPAWGGTLARFLYPAVLAEAKAKNVSAPEMEAWGWLPPALIEEGGKVQSAWLLKYLQNPTAIRPATVMPMPKFNLTAEEAATLAKYFAANSQSALSAIPSPKSQDPRPKTNDQSLRFVLDANNSCAKCHLIGDYRPVGEGRNLAPNLAEAGGRLQRQYIHRWLADPKTVLPYTPMPQNFPPQGETKSQDLLPGGGLTQLDAVEQLLVEYDEYAKGKLSIRKMMPPPSQQPQDGL
jgi:cbb3-type cytochrome oxidase cytochrome c subunit